ncbi:MAG: nucleotidyltransferase family protein [Solobacterium sp.]|nr:nucleotidyltransferase family protein [Solobacterium sp.]
MKLCAIAAEYNPFHTGHAYHIEEARKQSGCDLIMAVMSGDFVQRGEPAVADKVTRAVTAVKNGADIVVSLPYLFSTQSASVFAHGSVEIMKAAGASHIAFGSECANLENLLEIAETPINPDHLQENLDAGMAFPKAYSLLTTSMKPNDILAVCYLKEIAGTGITPVLIPRTSDYADDTLKPVSSALAIRRALNEGKSVAGVTPMTELEDAFIPWMERYYPYLRTSLLLTDRNILSEYLLFSEGIENHLKEKAKACSTWQEFLSAATTYRYTASRIRRTCLQAMIQMRKEEVKRLPAFDTIQVLAFNDAGKAWLHDMRKKEVRIVSRFARIPFPWRDIEFRSALLYTSVFEEEKRREILKREIGGAVYVK